MKAVFVGGKYNGCVMDVSEVWAFSDGKTENLSAERARGSWVHRAELDDQPTVKGYAGPMWDGGMLRYETWDVYNMMCN